MATDEKKRATDDQAGATGFPADQPPSGEGHPGHEPHEPDESRQAHILGGKRARTGLGEQGGDTAMHGSSEPGEPDAAEKVPEPRH